MHGRRSDSDQDFSGTRWGGIYDGWNIHTCLFINADMRRSSFRGAELSCSDFSGADLRGADLTGANLRECDFAGANIAGADFTRSSLVDADLRGAIGAEFAITKDAITRGADLPAGWGKQ